MSRYFCVYQILISNAMKLILLTLNFWFIKQFPNISYLFKSREIRYRFVSWKMQADFGILINRFWISHPFTNHCARFLRHSNRICFWFTFVRITKEPTDNDCLYSVNNCIMNFISWFENENGENFSDLENELICWLA